MDGGNGSVDSGSTVPMFARVPAELKFLVKSWQSANRMRSFNEALSRLLETHPDLARHAASLYTDSNPATNSEANSP